MSINCHTQLSAMLCEFLYGHLNTRSGASATQCHVHEDRWKHSPHKLVDYAFQREFDEAAVFCSSLKKKQKKLNLNIGAHEARP
mmetsp:Transcript_14387/g.24532  ORF Transcript_14387/g.24532 Transcript_14387/m.24532 type:complete len:84 (-) Transcript_14387:392-643(-)